jgi:hypothetical protein
MMSFFAEMPDDADSTGGHEDRNDPMPEPQSAATRADYAPDVPAAEDGPTTSPTAVGDEAENNSRRHENPELTETLKAPVKKSRGKAKATSAGSMKQELASLLQEVGLTAATDSGTKYTTAESGALDLLYEHLSEVYTLDAGALAEAAQFPRICKLRRVAWTVATKKKPDIAVLKICHPGISAKKASRLATALQFARLNGVEANQLSVFLRENGGIDGCTRKFRKRNADSRPAGDRPNSTSPKESVLEVGGAPHMEDGMHRIVIEIVGGRARFSKLLAELQPDEPGVDMAA